MSGCTEAPIVSSIASGKGGVGKTFIAANLAACLGKRGRKVLVVDCDLGLANMDILLGIAPRFTLQDVIFGGRTIEEAILPTKAGFDLIPASSGVKEMAQLLYEKIQMVKTTLAAIFSGYDHVLLDTGAGISEVVLQFNLLAPRNFVVLNREPTSLTDAYALIKVMHQRFQRSAFGIIVNAAEDETEARRLFGHIDSVSQDFLHLPLHYLGHIVSDRAVPRSIVNREVLVNAHPGASAAVNLTSLAEAICDWRM